MDTFIGFVVLIGIPVAIVIWAIASGRAPVRCVGCHRLSSLSQRFLCAKCELAWCPSCGGIREHRVGCPVGAGTPQRPQEKEEFPSK
jgi:hypothetical protein